MLAARVLEVDREGKDSASKLRRLLDSMTPDELASVPGQWIKEGGSVLMWEDNLVDWATACLDR